METLPLVAFAGKSVAPPVIGFIFNKAVNYLTDLRGATRGMEERKMRVLANIDKIRAVYKAIDSQQNIEQKQQLDQWLWRLRDAVEEAEDALDEIEYYRIKEKRDKVRAFIAPK